MLSALSWWYLKANRDTKSETDGVMNWTDARPDISPHGWRYVYEKTGWPVVAHNREWDAGLVYAKRNGGSFDDSAFVWSPSTQFNESFALPVADEFWDSLFANAKHWGLINYQLDWMFTQQTMTKMLSNISMCSNWHAQMDRALAKQGMHFGFGGTMMANYLQSTEMTVVTNGRTTGDYHADLTDQWAIGVPSIVSYALGVIPAKGGFWSTAVQPGDPYSAKGSPRSEPYSALHAAVSTLTRGPVSPADKVSGHSRPDRYDLTCMFDSLCAYWEPKSITRSATSTAR